MASSGLKLYFDLMSQPSRAVYMFLKLTNIPFQACPIALRKGEHFGEEYTKINPFQLVPAIDDNGFKLTESVAILKYLAEKNQVADHWYPKDLYKRARVDAYMAWQHIGLRLNGSMVFRTKLLDPLLFQKPVNKEKLWQFEAGLEKVLDQIENIFLKDQKYICGNDLSIGDLLAICELMQPIAANHKVFENRPLLEAWSERVKERLQPHFNESHKFLLALGSKL